MKHWILGGVSAAAVIAGATESWSLTAQQAWESWKETASSYGQSLTSSGEATMDGKLTVSGMTLTSTFDDMTATGTIEEVVFAEQNDGSVVVTLSEQLPVTLSGTDATGDKIDLALSMSQPGLALRAEDADGITTFAYEGPTLSVTLDELKVNDQPVEMEMSANVSDLSGRYTLDSTTEDETTSQFNAASAELAIAGKDPEGPGTFTVSATLADIEAETTSFAMDSSDSTDMAQLLADGFASRGTGSYGPVTFSADFQDESDSVSATGSLTGGAADFALDATRFAYDVAYEGLDVAVTGSAIPLPQVTAQVGRSATVFEMPSQPSETAAPFALKVALEDLSLGEEVWSLFDPAAVLPRDPATLILDLAGTGRWLVDIFDETSMTDAMMESDAPGELEELTLNAFELSLGGAELSGTGAFTFDNSQTSSQGGAPRPEGKASLKLTGGNALIDNLAKMGLIPQDQVMMVRMMTGMFAKPGAGPDELLSDVEINANGQMLINGAPMPF